MLLERIYDDDLAQASYFIGCQAEGEAIVVDPRRDIDVYLDVAAKNGMTITAVTETHIHADFLSGTRELAARTGARIHVSDEGGPDWTYGPDFDAVDSSPATVRMKHGHRIQLGNITVEAVHTPGHTPEHMSFLVTDGAQSPEPGFMLTGDFVFVGELGRPDLLDEAAGGIDTRFAGAKDLFTSLRTRFLTLPDYVQVLPGHGAGSACGKALGAIPTSTVGYERSFSWWGHYLEEGDEAGFVDEILHGQPDPHAYFSRMKVQNRQGPTVLGGLDRLVEHTPAEVRAGLDSGRVVLVDTRSAAEVHTGTVAGSLNIPGPAKTAGYGAWVIDPETDDASIVLLAGSQTEAELMRDHLIRVGIDSVDGYITSLDGLDLVTPNLVSPTDLDAQPRSMLLDVRNRSEHADGHIPDSHQLSAGRLMWHLDELPAAEDGPLVSYCQSGVRNSIAASALRRAGYEVVEIDGSYAAWAQAARG